MKHKINKHPINELHEQQIPRKSMRERKQTKYQDYLVGSNHYDDLFGIQLLDDEYSPKKRRKNYRLDDNEEYYQGSKCCKKIKQNELNKIQSLLQWKFTNQILPITTNHLSSNNIHLYKIQSARNISSLKLSSIATDLLAIFVNIQWNQKGQTLEDFKNLKLQQNNLMSKGLVFVWTPKQNVLQLLQIMEQKNFTYVQNFEIINFDIQKAKLYSKSYNHLVKHSSSQNQDKPQVKTEIQDVNIKMLIKSLSDIEPNIIIAQESSKYFNISKRTLLMFKKNSNLKFELRHQRTCDVVFDMPQRLGEKCDADLKNYIYNMIETLLPDCLALNETSQNEFDFKMMQLWADPNSSRRGWISVVQQ